ncbi:unnamed protein product [Rodentolepis nana]|uniref:Uncharacterized protein n=1 Tax=Rodentolepis nana TaxID=102285 RepID=A0A0R3TFV6_RODNA|nr:unnamed protein product [Rodentolepis nana]
MKPSVILKHSNKWNLPLNHFVEPYSCVPLNRILHVTTNSIFLPSKQLKRNAQKKNETRSARKLNGNSENEILEETRFEALLHPYTEIRGMTLNGSEPSAVARLMSLQNVEQNFLSIIISRPAFDIIRTEEKAVVTLTSLFSQIGGLLSIWVGITMICIVEVAEFLLNCFDVLCARKS